MTFVLSKNHFTQRVIFGDVLLKFWFFRKFIFVNFNQCFFNTQKPLWSTCLAFMYSYIKKDVYFIRYKHEVYCNGRLKVNCLLRGTSEVGVGLRSTGVLHVGVRQFSNLVGISLFSHKSTPFLLLKFKHTAYLDILCFTSLNILLCAKILKM